MRIAAMGAGGVGGYFGARLQQAGHEVTFFARGRHLEAIRENGLAVESPHGSARLKVRVFADPSQAEPVDVVLFAVKLWDTESAAAQIRPIVGPATVVIPFQNGVESIERLRKVLPERAVMGGSAYIATHIKSPGVIEHTGQMARIQFGPVVETQRPAAESFLAGLQRRRHPGRNSRRTSSKPTGRSSCSWSACPAPPRWRARRSAWCAPTRTCAGCSSRRCARPGQLGRARGVALADDFVEKQLAFPDTLPADMRASMLHDLEAGNAGSALAMRRRGAHGRETGSRRR